jgi:hypothetical protein
LVKHSNIEHSFYKYVSENIATPYNYAIGYGNLRYKPDADNTWVTMAFGEMGAGAKTFSPLEIDVVSRIVGETYPNNETSVLDILREKLTNVSIPVYDFSSETPVLIPYERIIVKNSEGRLTVDRIVLDNLREGDLRDNLRRSTIFLRLMLLTDTVSGRVIT